MAVPKYRTGSAKTTQKTTGTGLTPGIPTGIENGDLVLCMFEAYNVAAAPPTITVPAGWNVIGGGEKKDESTANKGRSWVLAWRIYEGSMGGEWKVSAEAGNSINAYLVVIEKGTFSKATPVSVESAWTQGAASATQTCPAVTAAVSESLGLIFVSSPATPKAPSAGWSRIEGGIAGPGLESFQSTKAGGFAAGESTGEPTYEKTGTNRGDAITLLIAPPGAFSTLTTTQGQSPLATGLRALLRALTTAGSQAVTAAKAVAKTLPTVSQGQASSVTGKQGKGGEVQQGQEARLLYSVTPAARTVTQPQTVSRQDAIAVRRSIAQPQAPSQIHSKPAILPTATQGQAVAAGGQAERVKRAAQPQTVTRAQIKVARVVLSTFNELVPRVNKLLPRTIPTVTQTQHAIAGKTQVLALFVAQAQAAILSRLRSAAPIHGYAAEETEIHSYGGDA